MQKDQASFKRPPARYQPKGLSILYEDRELLVVNKASGLLTIGTDSVRDKTAYFRLTEYVRKGNRKSRHRIFIVHRLDKDTSGVLVFAKSEESKRYLQDHWQEFHKKYYALVHGRMAQKEGVITSYLAENRFHKIYSVADPKMGKYARTGYKVLQESSQYSLLEIELLTGRKNQIRVHLSDKGCPVVGDDKYGVRADGGKRLALHAATLTLTHPYSKEKMTFTTKIPACFEILMRSPA